MKNKLFKEKQGFQGKDLLFAIALIVGLVTYQTIVDVFFAEQQAILLNTLRASVVLVLVYWMVNLYRREQKNVVTDKKIICQINSWYKAKKKIPLENIEQCSIVRTPLAAQWHGVNLSLPGEEMWSINGRNGLSISTKDGKRIFIGSRKPEKMAQVIKEAITTD